MSRELAGAELGDERLSKRLCLLAGQLSARPGESFPKALNDAELEAAYRFFGNENVSPEAILAPHFRQSARRAAATERIIVVHDTTAFEFGGQTKRDGLGHLIKPSAQGFFGHFSLALAADGTRTPLGLLAVETVFRLEKRIGHKNWSPDQSLGESARWLRGVEAAEALLDGQVDRRLVEGDAVRLRAAAAAAKVTFRREVPLSPRPKTCRSRATTTSHSPSTATARAGPSRSTSRR